MGDLGLEGFSEDGICYQCYAAREPLGPSELYEKQRDKITTDTAKFIDNRIKLAVIFGTLKIKRWLLVVPRFDSTSLLEHCGKRAKKVRDASLPYVTDDYMVGVITDAEFEVELHELTHLGLHLHELTITEPGLEELEQFQAAPESSQLQLTLDGKASKVPKLAKANDREEFTHHIVKHYLRGQVALAELRNRDPEQFERYLRIKKTKENTLVVQSMLATSDPSTLTGTMEAFKIEVQRGVAVSPHTAELLAWESVSDWLLRCPLDF
jgi:hypothetical protein